VKTKPKKPGRKRRGCTDCPKCHSPFSSVLRSSGVKRNRRCSDCGFRYETRETVFGKKEKVTPVSPEIAELATGVASLAKLLESSPVLRSALQESPLRTFP